MKIYKIYPTDENGILLGSAILLTFSKKEAFCKFKELEIYSENLGYTLVEDRIGITANYLQPKVLKIKTNKK